MEATYADPAGRPDIGTGERTKRQIVQRSGGSFGRSPLPASYETYRKIRCDPTIALARALSIAPILAAEWSIESSDTAPAEAVDFIDKTFLATREPFMERALFGGCDFGHQSYEKVFDYDPETGRIRLKKLKPLLPDITEILVDEATGAFVGFKQKEIVVPLANSLLVYFRVEGTDWHGEPLLENARDLWNQWVEANVGANRYDRLVAGARHVVHYPEGRSLNEFGQDEDNAVIASRLLDTLESGKGVAINDVVRSFASSDALNSANSAWRIEILEDSGGRQPTFIERLRYLDSLKCRAMLMPERAILEGQFGTLAESQQQGDLALTNAELTHRHVTRLVNWHCVDQVLALNWGQKARGTVWLKASPIQDAKLAYLRQVYQTILANPSGFLEEFGNVDAPSLRDLLGVPTMEEPEGGGVAGEPLPGVDANDPRGAVAAGVYAPPAAEPASVQQQALNGSQIESLLSLVTQAAQRALPVDTVRALIAAAFPMLSGKQIADILEPVMALPPQTLPQTAA